MVETIIAIGIVGVLASWAYRAGKKEGSTKGLSRWVAIGGAFVAEHLASQ